MAVQLQPMKHNCFGKHANTIKGAEMARNSASYSKSFEFFYFPLISSPEPQQTSIPERIFLKKRVAEKTTKALSLQVM